MKSIHYNLAVESNCSDDDNDDGDDDNDDDDGDGDDDGRLGFRDGVKWLRLKSELIWHPKKQAIDPAERCLWFDRVW